MRLVEETQLEREEEGQGGQQRVRRDLKHPVSEHRSAQPVHGHRVESRSSAGVGRSADRKGPAPASASLAGAPARMAATSSDPIVNFATDFIDAVGAVGVFMLMTLESACIPVPSEAIMLFAGFNVSEGSMTLIGIIVAGVAGNLVGSWIAYGVGYYGRLELLEKNRLIHVNPKHLAHADRWFERHGDATVFFARMLPIVRTFISLPAGVARMPFWRFTAFTALGCIPWVLALAFIGRGVGDNWENWRDKLHYLDYPIVLRDRRRARLAVAPLAPRRRARRRPRGRLAAPAPAGRRARRATGGLSGERGARRRGAGRHAARGSGDRPRARPGPDRAAPGLQLRPPAARALALGWEHERLDPEHRKAFEVAVHGGAALALLIGQRHLIADELRRLDLRRLSVIALSFLPPAIAGLAFERQIERRLGGPGGMAAGLAAGSVAMLLADRSAAGAGRRRGHRGRRARARPARRRRRSRRASPATAPRWSPPAPPLLARAVEPALPHGRAAGDRRRRAAQGRAPAAARNRSRARSAARARASAALSPRRSPRRG